MGSLLARIRDCQHCAEHLPHGVRPVVQFSTKARILIIGQAPGAKVHASGVPWKDASGNKLREWLGIDEETFYDASQVALVPMGFCYPGKGKSGDLPPRPECEPKWHSQILEKLPHIELTLLIGQFAQKHYLGKSVKANLTETVKSYRDYLPAYLPLPHPSPRNRHWLSKNDWFEKEVIPELRTRMSRI